MALDATISLLEKQNTILESISTQLQNQQNAVRASKLADKEDADKNRALMERIASSLGGGRGAAPAADSGGGETKKGGILGGLLAGAIGVVGSIGGILGAKSPLGLAVTKFKQSGVAKTFVSIFEKIKGFFVGIYNAFAESPIGRFLGLNPITDDEVLKHISTL